MRRRHPIPRVWLMTDPRMGDALFDALERLPRRAGVVFRHYGDPDRRALFARVRRIARRRRLTIVSANTRLKGADGVHNARWRGRGTGLRSRAVHSLRELRRAEREAVDVVFVSPVFATRSHPGTRPLGTIGIARLAQATTLPVIALGGMTARRFRPLARSGIHGWAAIDAWIAS